MLDRAKLDAIIATVSQVLRPEGFDCIEAEWVGNERILRLFVDHVDETRGPINLDACVAASRLLLEYQPLDDLVAGKYTLEVSSPGVERPLRRLSDFAKAVGSNVQVKLKEKVQERRNGVGRLVELKAPTGADTASDIDTSITLETAEGVWTFPLGSLQRAHLVYDWDNA